MSAPLAVPISSRSPFGRSVVLRRSPDRKRKPVRVDSRESLARCPSSAAWSSSRSSTRTHGFERHERPRQRDESAPCGASLPSASNDDAGHGASSIHRVDLLSRSRNRPRTTNPSTNEVAGANNRRRNKCQEAWCVTSSPGYGCGRDPDHGSGRTQVAAAVVFTTPSETRAAPSAYHRPRYTVLICLSASAHV